MRRAKFWDFITLNLVGVDVVISAFSSSFLTDHYWPGPDRHI